MVGRELVQLPTLWDLHQITELPFAFLVKFYQNFLLCPHSHAHSFPGVLYNWLIHLGC